MGEIISWIVNNLIEICLLAIIVLYAPVIYRKIKQWIAKWKEPEVKNEPLC